MFLKSFTLCVIPIKIKTNNYKYIVVFDTNSEEKIKLI